MKKTFLATVAVMMFASLAFAQREGAAPAATGGTLGITPGQAWSALGNIDPTDKGNTISESYVEQGLVVKEFGADYSLEPFVSFGITRDISGRDYNNRQVYQIGAKVNKLITSQNEKFEAVFSAIGGYAYEQRRDVGSKGGFFGEGLYWMGWNLGSRFPGSGWGAIGNLSPVEKNNLIGVTDTEQDYRLAHLGKYVTLLPYGNLALQKDTAGYDWENYVRYGGGAKLLLFPTSHANTELLAGYVRENRFKSDRSAGGFQVQLRLWLGWSMLKKGGR